MLGFRRSPERKRRMPRFLALYTMQPEDLARFRAMSKAEQDRIDSIGLPQWQEWEEKHAASIPNRGGMVGKTLRVGRTGIAPAVNQICGYLIVEAETIEAAAELFVGHPHITLFPGDGIDLMPFVTEPPKN
jgi:hypothetical protein